MKEFYVYVYLDPRKPGKYTFENLGHSFLFEPIYIGKGKKLRIESHLYDNARNRLAFFPNVLRKVISEGFDPIRFKLIINLGQIEAFEEECRLIKIIGRRDLKEGPLLNLAEGGNGGKGRKGKTNSDEHKKKCSEKLKGRKFKKETLEKMSKAKLGKKLNEAHVNVLKEVQKERFEQGLNKTAFGVKKVKCPHCEVKLNQGLIKRWHFDNCKFKLV